MERPAWTITFAVLWGLIAVGAVLSHLAIGKVHASLKELPDRLDKGMEEVLGLGTLTAETVKVKSQALDVLYSCSFFDLANCDKLEAGDARILWQTCGLWGTTVNAKKAKDAILASFDAGLEKVQKFSKDKYFGRDNIKEVGTQLDAVLDNLKSAPDEGDCCAQAGAFCKIHEEALKIQKQTAEFQAQVSKMTHNTAVNEFEEGADMLVFLHALPYILVLSTICFTGLWWKNGACCCCKGGSMLDCVAPITLQAIFWLLAFIIMSIIAGIGSVAGRHWLMEYEFRYRGTFVGDPTVGELLDHIQAAFPEFWKFVFDGLIEGLLLLRTAATVFVLVCILIAIYSCAFCAFRPYEVQDGQSTAPSSVKGGTQTKTENKANS